MYTLYNNMPIDVFSNYNYVRFNKKFENRWTDCCGIQL